MRLTRYFLPVLKENPAEAQIVSHRYMLRAGMIKQQAAGIYSWLPMGFKVLKRIEQIVHEEQQRAGHIPLLMPTLQPADLWRGVRAGMTTTGRRCCASRTGRIARCCMGPRTRR